MSVNALTTLMSTSATSTASRGRRRRRGLLVAVGLLLLLRADGGRGAPRAWSSSNRDEETTKGDDIITDTESGRVRGIRHHAPYLRRPVDAYLGIPFAKPPLHSLRFRHPKPIEKWRNIYNATRLPNSCYQIHDTVFGTDFYGSSMWNPPGKVSEDCLYLNVWVPYNRPRTRRSPVMVWIYGGGFYSGTTTLNLYDGKILADHNNIIVVSIGYRVGAFGFLSLDHPNVPGNAGMFDQLMALEWVQQNIRHFGGDPNTVTLFGESAGSVSVSLHLLSPLSHGKFHRAIMQSGSANMPWATLTQAEAKRRSLELATILGCQKTDVMPDVADCLRQITPQRLADEQFVARGPLQFPFLPVVDGIFLPDTPKNLLSRGAFKRCPLLTGSNVNEGSYFIIYELDQYMNLTHITMTRHEFQLALDYLFLYFPQYPQKINPFAIDAVRYQYTNWQDQNDIRENVRMLEAALGESQFICPGSQWALAYAEAGEKVYSYYFTQRYSVNPWPRWMGVMHGDEIMFVFGEALKRFTSHNYSLEDRQLSQQIMTYWTNFAKTSDPNQAPGERSLGEWPLHTPTSREYLELNSRFLGQRDRSRAVGRGPRMAECAFWDVYLPQLVERTENLQGPIHGQITWPNFNVNCSSDSGAAVGSLDGCFRFSPSTVYVTVITLTSWLSSSLRVTAA